MTGNRGLSGESKHVIDRMASIRKKKGLSLRQLAEVLNVSASNLQKMEAKNIKFLDMSFVFLFCQRLDISMKDDLLPPEKIRDNLTGIDDFFDAGRKLGKKVEKNNEKRNENMKMLNLIEDYCKKGIKAFYQAVEVDNPDVYIQRDEEHVLRIWFGLRPIRVLKMAYTGPKVLLMVLADGDILWASTKNWTSSREVTSPLDGEAINLNDWQTDIRNRLVDFINNAEESYIKINS